MEPAVEFKRVSTTAQDVDLQEFALARNREAHDLDVRHVFTLRGKSAYAGEQEATLDRILCIVQLGEIRVVSVASLDRLERRGPLALQRWMTAIVQSGGKVVGLHREDRLAGQRRKGPVG